MSRLQVGGLALVLKSKQPENVGRVVTLISHIGNYESPWNGEVYDYWEIKHQHHKDPFYCPSFALMPLGDDKGIELYGLREEIMTKHDKEAV